MKEAVAKMKAELGDDAVILHTKKYKEGGLLGLGSKEIVEITAAIEDEKPEPKKEPEIPQRPMMPQTVLSQYKTNGTAEGVAMAERELNPPPRNEGKSSLFPADPVYEEEETDATMDPNINQASSLETAMNPNQREPRPDPPMPYDTAEDPRVPYEVDISSRSDLNTPKSESAISAEGQANETAFIKSQSMELSESDVENEPDENVYSADPPANNVVENSDVSGKQAVQPYNSENSVIDSSTTQVNAIQSSEIRGDTAVQPVSEIPQQSQQQAQPSAPPQVQQIQPQPQPIQNSQINNTAQNVAEQTSQQYQPVQSQSVQSQQVPVQPQPQPQSPKSLQVNPQQAQTPQQQPSQSSQAAATVQSNQVENPQAAQAVPTNAAEQATNQQQADMSQTMTPAQLAQTQAMMMAQFNQMQMAQAMQQAVAQVQAQAQEQIRQVYLQAQQEHQQQRQADLKEIGKLSSVNKTVEDSPESQDKIRRLENEIAQMKALLAQVMGKDGNRGSISLHEALRRQEINEEILNSMAAQVEAGETLADSQSREAKATLTKFLNENMNCSEGIKLNRHGVRIAALLGTTGVGKTTTLAKIAAKFVLEQGISAALITADTYRISAVEQLRTYSDILGLPLEIVYTPAELSKAINKHRNKDLILIDTAGRSQYNEFQMKELQEFLRANPRIEKHVVLSTTTKSSDAIDILEKFSVCEPDKVIFTKTDETASLGLILNLLYKQKLSLSYITNGQSVPDDIIPASSEVLADLLLRKNISISQE